MPIAMKSARHMIEVLGIVGQVGDA